METTAELADLVHNGLNMYLVLALDPDPTKENISHETCSTSL
jgi:hypothetical protein